MACRMASLPVTCSDLVVQSCSLFKLKCHIPREIQRVLSMICLHINPKVYVSCNFNYLFENEGLLSVTVSHHVHCKCGNIWESVPDSIVVVTDH